MSSILTFLYYKYSTLAYKQQKTKRKLSQQYKNK